MIFTHPHPQRPDRDSFGDRVSEMSQSFILFQLGQDTFALPTHTIHQIVSPRALHTIPKAKSPLICGVINYQGRLVCCLSLHHLFLVQQRQSGPLIALKEANDIWLFPTDLILGIYSCNAITYKEQDVVKGILSLDQGNAKLIDEKKLFECIKKGLA